MTILVTGATGFIGRRLVQRLSMNGDRIRCLVRDLRRGEHLRSLGVEIVEGNLNSPASLERCLDGIEVLYHVAGVTRASSTREYYRGNHLATHSLIQACVRYAGGLKRFVHLSSLAAVGPAVPGGCVTEKTEFHPVSHYGTSKMLAELEVQKAAQRFPITILRPVAVYGPGDGSFLEYFRLIKHGILPVIGYQKKFINLIYVDDLVEGILRAARHPRGAGETYFLGDEESYSIEEIGTTIGFVMDVKPRTVHVPAPFVYLYGIVSEIVGKARRRPVLFNIQKVREGLQPSWNCSVEKAKAEIGFSPSVSLYDGMKKTYEWYISNGSLSLSS